MSAMLPRRAFCPVQYQFHVRRRLNVHFRRFLCSSAQRRAFVGPPDPVSNIRPVIYDEIEPAQSLRRRKGKDKENGEGEGEGKEVEAGPAASSGLVEQTNASPTHPYALDEFNGDPLDYQWRIERSRLDAYNHAFWKDSNTRFEEAKQAVLSSLPESSPPEAREAALSEFYGQWLKQEQERLRVYSDDWSRRNFGGILLAARAAIRQFQARLFGTSTSRPPSPPRSTFQSNDENQN